MREGCKNKSTKTCIKNSGVAIPILEISLKTLTY